MPRSACSDTSLTSNKEEQAFLAKAWERAARGEILIAKQLHGQLERATGRELSLGYLYALLHRHGWRKLGPRPRHPRADQDEQQKFKKTSRDHHANAEPVARQHSAAAAVPVDTDTMSLFLEHTATRFAQQHCLLLFDGAGGHTAGALRVPSNISLVPLPSYSPELNPTEHIWDHLRENYIGNRVFPSLDGVIRQLCRGLHDLHFDAKLVRSLTCFN